MSAPFVRKIESLTNLPTTPQPATAPQKKRVLVWSDSVTATTGFGVVSKHILKALHNTGRYEIDQLAINYFGDFVDKREVPYSLVPARLGNPKDPYGRQMFISSIQKKEYDIVFIINDTFVVEDVASHIQKVRDIKRDMGHKIFKLVYYYPVDCRLLPSSCTMVRAADVAVPYTNFADRMSRQVEGIDPAPVIYHGADIHSFYPLPPDIRYKCRVKWLNITDPDRFLLISVNRNSVRKDIARTILAFAEFRKHVPNSCLYLHTAVQDGMGGPITDLQVPCEELGFSLKDDVIFPRNFRPASGFPIEVLNQLYNCADAFITTNLGEGWGLTLTEAMAAGLPVISPNHTSAPEILGNGVGYLYDCKEQVYVDNSGFRPMGRMEDIVEQMLLCHQEWQEARQGTSQTRLARVMKGQNFTRKYSWENVCQDWVKLFDGLESVEAKDIQARGEKL
jgi:glycosyltransferase involved in cell wall biosynthesis